MVERLSTASPMRSPETPALAQTRRSEQALGVSVALCALSAATLLWVGGTPATAWTFFLGLLLVVLPFAYGLARGLFLLETLLRGHGLVPPVGVALGVAVTWCYRLHNPVFVFSCLLLLAIVGVDCRRDRARLRYVAAVVGTMFTGFVTVSNLSYLIARLTFDRVHDPALRDLDLTIYRAFVPGLRYEGLFPLTDSALWFHLLENAYMMLFPEIVVVLVVLHLTGSDILGRRPRHHRARRLVAAALHVAGMVPLPHGVPDPVPPSDRDRGSGAVLRARGPGTRGRCEGGPLGRGGARGRRPRPEPRLWPATGDAPVPAVLYRAGEHEQPGREAA